LASAISVPRASTVSVTTRNNSNHVSTSSSAVTRTTGIASARQLSLMLSAVASIDVCAFACACRSAVLVLNRSATCATESTSEEVIRAGTSARETVSVPCGWPFNAARVDAGVNSASYGATWMNGFSAGK